MRLVARIANKRLSAQAARKSAQRPLRLLARLEQNLFWWKMVVMTSLSLLFMTQLGLWLWDARTLPITLIRIDGQHYTTPQKLKALISGIQGGFFSIDLSRLESALLNLPWIKTVQIQRQWPATLVIQLQERQPLARWQTAATQTLTLIDAEGQLFVIPHRAGLEAQHTLEYLQLLELPLFLGSPGSLEKMFLFYKKINLSLSAMGLSIQELGCNARQAWYMVFTNGIKLWLGTQERDTALHRFTQIYPHIVATQKNPVNQVDLRYTHGMAVHLATGQ